MCTVRTSLTDYAARLENLEDMSLAEFAANYTYRRESTNDVTHCEDDLSGASDTELQFDDHISEESIINLQNGLGCMRKRKKKAIIRWHNFNIETSA